MNKPGFFNRPEALAQAEKISGAVQRYRQQLEKTPSTNDPASRLRYERKQEWLEIAIPSLLGESHPQNLCRRWSDFADRTLSEAFRLCFTTEQVALFALGKLGSHELNLSSDVDLLIVAKDERSTDLSGLRKFQKLLAELSSDGFVFRVDFDLRPGGRMGPLLPTVDQLIDYYGNYGETWERMAFVRLRPLAGAPSIQQEVLSFVERFSFRKHLDFTLFEELKLLRRKIHAESWRPDQDDQYDLKRGLGGIRDVELFFHALQVIHGGKDSDLRVRGTSQAAQCLAGKGLLPKEDADFLIAHYWNLRSLENFVQALDDQQTHQLCLSQPPEFPPALQDAFINLPKDRQRTDAIVSSLLGTVPPAPSAQEIQTRFADPLLQEHLSEILSIPMLSRNKERDEQTRRAFLERFLQVLEEQNADLVMALDQLRDFLKAVRAKSSFFNLFLRENDLLKEIAWLFGHSRYLGRLLCFRPELLDSFVFRRQDLESKDLESLLEDLTEKRLLSEIIEGSHFLKTLDLARANQALTMTADEIINTLCLSLKKDHPSDVILLALGKWGAQEMGFRSDLDLVFVHPKDPQEADLKFAKRLISRLTDPHRGGNIYPIDLRLRPSGKAGPLVISWTDLQDYLKNTAAPWERQAYLRGRWIGPNLGDFQSFLLEKPLSSADLLELNRIRMELLNQQKGLDLKYSEGGLLDIELAIQTQALVRRQPLKNGNTLAALENDPAWRVLRINYESLRQIEQLLQLISLESTTSVGPESQLSQHLTASLPSFRQGSLAHFTTSLLQENQEQLLRLDPRRGAS